ncbi:ubiquitin carboxyl-terminal hydrolase 36-like [Frankliniella occidentalis]|uniref:Ubiquitin carboxyl-terminal hydrolase 36 n=1 Tax=Frankliniella occidentalis TaxID=133901 RepID=A0A9C6X835_FRAOC|nr:ubiquitin carboxyl-terminal hydrolase 36-like [Frankliniella occidentalis]
MEISALNAEHLVVPSDQSRSKAERDWVVFETPSKRTKKEPVTSTSKWDVHEVSTWQNDTPPPKPKISLCPPLGNEAWKWQGVPHALCGLQNLGNSCFINSTLQALFHLPAVLRWFVLAEKAHRRDCRRSLCLSCCIFRILIEMIRSRGSFRPAGLMAVLRVHLKGRLMNGKQEDCQEFLISLLDCLDNEFLHMFQQMKLDYVSKLTTPMNRIFLGWLKTSCTCLNCGFVGDTYAPFCHLEITPQPNVKCVVQDHLFNYFNVQDGIPLKCRGCKVQATCKRKYNVYESPHVLVVQILRYVFDQKTLQKNEDPFHLDKEVQLPQGGQYILNNAIVHLGVSVDVGHYKTISNCPPGVTYCFNDAKVVPGSFDDLDVQKGAYILFYSKKDTEPDTLKKSNATPTLPVKDLDSKTPEQKEHKGVPPLTVRRTKRTEPKASSSQSSHDYKIVENTFNHDEVGRASRVSPLIVKQVARCTK